MNQIVKRAFIDAIGTALYIVIVASFMYYMQGNFPDDFKTVFIPIAMLLLFVFSAALTGILVFGKPAMLYLDGKRKEAILLVGYTLGILLILTVAAFTLLVVLF
ncbi:MAG: hypothetical protein AABY22_08380 [Nanoarchaeota archaeon]